MERKGEGYVCILSYSCIHNAGSNVVWSEYGQVGCCSGKGGVGGGFLIRTR